MKYVIDFLAVLGVIFVSTGVFIQFGIGYALIVLGALVLKLALISAYINQNATNEAPEK